MTTKFKQKLFSKLLNKQYRDAFVAEHISTGIPFQIASLRQDREWTQGQLGARAKMAPERISILENPQYGKFTISTLLKLASAFDVGLVVRFVSFGDIAEWEEHLSTTALHVPSFSNDPYFQESDISSSSVVRALDDSIKLHAQSVFEKECLSVDGASQARGKGIEAAVQKGKVVALDDWRAQRKEEGSAQAASLTPFLTQRIGNL